MKKHFKSGDKVQLRSGGPVMEVINYVEEDNPLMRMPISNSRVLCLWYDKYYGRKYDVFHQNSLVKSRIPVNGLFKHSHFHGHVSR